MPEFDILRNDEALAAAGPEAIVELTSRAVGSTFYRPGLTAEQIDATSRVPQMAAEACLKASRCEGQHLAFAFHAGRAAGFVIAARHGADDLELDWLMVDPSHQGSGLAARLMREGIGWLGAGRPIWLTVLRHNRRAISFYRRFGFEIDEATRLDRIVPTWVMRRPPGPLAAGG